MRASFEETIDVLCNAALYSESENARGVTTAIMTGQLAALGTGMARVLFEDRCAAPTREEMSLCLERGGKVRVVRSTCRSHTVTEKTHTLEYVAEDRPTAVRPMSPAGGRKRPRFRPASP
jgi:hypothetical protein